MLVHVNTTNEYFVIIQKMYPKLHKCNMELFEGNNIRNGEYDRDKS